MSGGLQQTLTVNYTARRHATPGSAQAPCSAVVTGAGSLEQTLTVTYTANTNAGTAHAAASFAGDANHQASADEKTFTIEQAVSVTTVSCPSTVTYTGSAQTPCSATVTGAGSLEQALTVNYTGNTNAGTAHAAASFAGDANHQASADEKTFTIEQAVSVTTVSCPSTVTYTGSAQTPCSATVTGAGSLEQALTVNYTANTNAGTAHAAASFAGDANHQASADEKTFTIEQAVSVTTVSCPSTVTYTGSAQTPCSATVTGAGSLEQALTVNYTGNTNAGTAHAAASFAGDANHQASADEKTFTIEQAVSVTTVSCPSTVTYTGSAQTPCSATVTGAGSLEQALTVNYTANTNAGTAHAAASFAGDANHQASADEKTFTIEQAVSVTTVTCPATVTVYRVGAGALQRGGQRRRQLAADPDGELHRQHERRHRARRGQLRR